MNLFCDKSFSLNFWQTVTGTGAVDISNGSLKITGVSTQYYATYLIRPGDTIKFRVNAKCTGAAGAAIRLDVETLGTTYDKVSVPVSPDFDIYEIEYTCPLTMTAGAAVMLFMGNDSSSTASTTSVFFNPCVELIGGSVSNASLRTQACGLVYFGTTPAGVLLNPGFVSFGIAELQWTTTYIRLIFDHVYADHLNSFQNKRPLAFISPTHEGGSLLYHAGSLGVVDATTDKRVKLDVYLKNPATGAAVNPQTVAQGYFFVEIKAP